MALGDIGMFNPAESLYSKPGAYEEMLRGEATKRAAYLSSMDQFYENLAEAQRQFNETLSFKTETRDLDLEFQRERAAAEDEYRSSTLDIENRKLDILSRSTTSSYDERKIANRYLDLLEAKQAASTELVSDYLKPRVTPGSYWEGPGTSDKGEILRSPEYYEGIVRTLREPTIKQEYNPYLGY